MHRNRKTAVEENNENRDYGFENIYNNGAWHSSSTCLTQKTTIGSQSEGSTIDGRRVYSTDLLIRPDIDAQSVSLSDHMRISENQVENDENRHQDRAHHLPQTSRARSLMMFTGLFFTIFLSGLDQVVTSTILTCIANDFKSLDRIEWVPTIFMLCSTSLNILSGRLSDIFGRLCVLMVSMAAFILGAGLSAISRNIIMFIIARGISGVGCGGMLSLSIIIISDILPIERRGKYLGFLQICFGVSNAVGPLVGGVFADRINWRAAFYSDMIMGALVTGYLVISLRLPKLNDMPWNNRLQHIDYLGITIIVSCISLLIVGMNMGGTLLSWSSPATIICLSLGIFMLVLFVIVEHKIPEHPLVPMWIFTVRNLLIACLVTFLCGMAMFSIIFYMPVYFSAVYGVNAMYAGVLVLPFGLSLSFSSFISGHIISKYGCYRIFLQIGPAIMLVGVLILSLMSGKISKVMLSLLLFIPGTGMGGIIVSNVIAAQAATDPLYIATVTPLCEFFLSIGGVIGVALFGAVYRNKLSMMLDITSESSKIQRIIAEARKDVSIVYNTDTPENIKLAVSNAYASSMKLGMWVLLPFLIVALFVSLAMSKNPDRAGPVANKNSEDVVPSNYDD